MGTSMFSLAVSHLVNGPVPPDFLALLPTFEMRLIQARAVLEDGTGVIEFDARAWLDEASEEDIILLCSEWFCGDGPGCRRLLERHSKDTQAFLAYAEAHKTSWVARIDTKSARQWIASHRPFLIGYIDPEMIDG